VDPDPEDNDDDDNDLDDDDDDAADSGDDDDAVGDDDDDDDDAADPPEDEFEPAEGVWVIESSELLEDGCGLESLMDRGLPGTELSLAGSGGGTFELTLGSGETIGCELVGATGDDYECDTHFQVDERAAELGFDASIPVELNSSGEFASSTEMVLHSDILLNCEGEDCDVVAMLLGTSFPCTMAMDSIINAGGR
jgi:hypothetical protein